MAGRPVRRARMAAAEAAAEEHVDTDTGEIVDIDIKEQAVRLHLSGQAPAAIADTLEITVTQAKQYIKSGVAAKVGAAELPDEIRTEIARLDVMLQGIWPAVQRGNFEAVDRALALADRRERLSRPKTNPRRMRKAFDATVAACKTTPMDSAIIEEGRMIADYLDEAMATQRGELLNKAMGMMPQYRSILTELLATPKARHDAKIGTEDAVGGKLKQLRSVTAAKKGA